MPKTAISMPDTTAKPSVRRPFARQSRRAIGFSAAAFFASVAVVGGWGISGLETVEEESAPTAQVIFAGGAPQRQTTDDRVANQELLAEDDYVIGEYGDPASELYAHDDDGGWGDNALDRASGIFASSDSGGRGRRRD